MLDAALVRDRVEALAHGVDAADRLDAILAALAFGTQPAFDAVEIEGIERVSIDDINRAADMGYRIKLLGVAQMTARRSTKPS